MNDLPADDLDSLNFDHFFGCSNGKSVKGVIGLEVFGTDGLLRSLAVASDARSEGLGTALLEKLEEHAHSVAVTQLYLLTETAEKYFRRKGFKTISREMASENIKSTKQFNELCPASAVLMAKPLIVE